MKTTCLLFCLLSASFLSAQDLKPIDFGAADTNTDSPIATALPEQTATEVLTIYPNPVVSQATIQLKNGMILSHAELFDLSGKEIPVSFIFNKEALVMERKQLEGGIYFLRMVAANGTVFLKKMLLM